MFNNVMTILFIIASKENQAKYIVLDSSSGILTHHQNEQIIDLGNNMNKFKNITEKRIFKPTDIQCTFRNQRNKSVC